jgi:hypothetical protein
MNRWEAPPSGQREGWYMYFDRDIRGLLAKKRSKVADRFNLAYCGKGHLKLCRQQIWTAIQSAGNQLTSQQGTADPAAWRASAGTDEFSYGPLPLVTSPYSNRPTGIQQVISFKK